MEYLIYGGDFEEIAVGTTIITWGKHFGMSSSGYPIIKVYEDNLLKETVYTLAHPINIVEVNAHIKKYGFKFDVENSFPNFKKELTDRKAELEDQIYKWNNILNNNKESD